MTLTELRTSLAGVPDVNLHVMLPNGEFVPAHFHLTEVGRVQKDFIDCGGTRRSAATCLLQLWVAGDVDHRLTSAKVAGILQLATPLFDQPDVPVELEYEGEFVSQFPLLSVEPTPGGLLLHLGTKHTDCLAPDRCGITPAGAGCTPGQGCC